jgi:DNA-binding SARP family transcriptional activator
VSLRIHLAGTVAIEAEGLLLDDWRSVGRQGRLIFALLAGEHWRAVPREELAEELWPGDPPPSWDRALSAIVSKLRGLIESAAVPGLEIASAFGCYQLRLPAEVWIDIETAAESIDRADGLLRAGAPKEAWGWAQVACHIARRPFLTGEESPWAVHKRAELRDVLVRAHEALSEIFIGSGEPVTATRHAKLAIELEPFRETAHQRLMRAHAAAGNRADALRAYERCRYLLAEELGVSPSPQTEAVYLDILRSGS